MSTISFRHTVNDRGADNGTILSNATESELLDKINDEIRRAVTPVSVFVGLEVFLGFFGNLFVLYVFKKRYHNCNFRYFVLCLAFLDFISTLTTMPGEILTQQYWYKYPFPIICKVKSFFNMFTVSGEAFCLCTIAVDRYRKVCAPFGWQIRPRQARILCGIIYVAAFAISLPVSFFWGIHKDVRIYRNRNVTVTICEKDAHYVDSRQPFVYATSVEVIIGICLVVMLVLYILVAKKLIISRPLAKRRQQSGAHMVSKSPALQTKFKHKTEISSGGGVSFSDVLIRNGIATKELSTTEMRSIDDESVPVDVNDVYSTDTETTREGGTSDDLHRHRSQRRRREIATRVRRKTYIMFVLTILFIVTTIMYMTLLAFISGGILKSLNDYEKAVYFFFFRLVFINHVINPFLYGCLDPQFKQILGDMKTYVLKTLRNG
ncbi:5-hydroxytryptamine receptor 1-like [Mya arenaria]|uniref:5-hydroxytryptamine receptor 1-like n=1 Tax=Mya arenaria TaxID=6604 RepID=UPI0022E8DAF9|nr:5-hydroxytryptamine receptor 1-like [Mya arenaria]XP_052773930.1 5-hydroxytryptamine receptor 1-like [Mya arenaria]